MLHFRLVSSPEARACVQNTLKLWKRRRYLQITSLAQYKNLNKFPFKVLCKIVPGTFFIMSFPKESVHWITITLKGHWPQTRKQNVKCNFFIQRQFWKVWQNSQECKRKWPTKNKNSWMVLCKKHTN